MSKGVHKYKVMPQIFPLDMGADSLSTEAAQFVFSWDWGVFIAGIALLVSAFNVWYTRLREGHPTFVCSRWTAVGMGHSDGDVRASFVSQVGVINNGNKAVEVKDLFLVAETDSGEKVLYDPIFLFNLSGYGQSFGAEDGIGNYQEGQVPLPVLVPANSQFEYEYPLLFLPYNERVVKPHSEAPFTLRLYAFTDRADEYELIARQDIGEEAVESLQNGSFSGVRSTESIANRDDFADRIGA